MSRVKGFTVALETDLREEDAVRVQNAIEWFVGVLKVTPIEANPDDWIIQQRVRSELGEKLFGILYPKKS